MIKKLNEYIINNKNKFAVDAICNEINSEYPIHSPLYVECSDSNELKKLSKNLKNYIENNTCKRLKYINNRITSRDMNFNMDICIINNFKELVESNMILMYEYLKYLNKRNTKIIILSNLNIDDLDINYYFKTLIKKGLITKIFSKCSV